jgi:hypothetical protein
VENTAGCLRCPERTAELGESNAEHVGPGGGTISARGNWTYDDATLDSVAQRALYCSSTTSAAANETGLTYGTCPPSRALYVPEMMVAALSTRLVA